MLALLVDPSSPGGIRLAVDYPPPTPTPGEVLVRVRLAGICSTDLELARGYMGFRGVPGHEFVGEVESGANELRGKRVVAEINCIAPQRHAGLAELRKHDPARTVLGIAGRDGAFAEHLTVPAANCPVVPPTVSDRQAVFAEPLAAAVQVLRDCPLQPGQRAAVLGSGRLGILVAQVLARQPCELTVVGRNSLRIELCRRLGLNACELSDVPAGRPFDVVVECSGAPDGLREALRLVRPRGTVVLKSTYAGAASMDLAPVVIDEIRVVGSRCGPMAAALELLAGGQVQVEPLISAVFPLSRGVEAFAAAQDPAYLKILLDPTIHE
jgi:threonine dehydrogenase-like Zn-dependent dehydrogenase